MSSLFRWDRFAMIYDTDTEYRSVHNAIATLLRRPDGGNKVTSTHGVNPSKPDSEIRDIFLQIRKYARGLLRSCVKVDVAVLGSQPSSLTVRRVSLGGWKATFAEEHAGRGNRENYFPSSCFLVCGVAGLAVHGPLIAHP